MAPPKLSAPVGLSPRKDGGAPVKNASKDVVLVRQMLAANGFERLADGKSVDGALLKAIEAFQRKIGFKKPDQIIDPGGKTLKALAPKYEKAQKEAAKIVMVEVKYRGKVLQVTEKDHQLLRLEVFKQLDSYMKSLIKNHKHSMKVYQSYLDTAMLKDGMLNAVAQAIIIKAGSVKMPKSSIATKSISATGALERAIMSKDLVMLDKALPEAEHAINAFNAEVLRFLKDFTGSAETTGTVLMVTSATCFAVVGALATPVLVTSAGMSAGAAAATSGAGVAVLKGASEELGKHASGQKVTVWGSVQSVVIDGAVGGLTGGLASKIPLGFCDKMAKAVAPKLASKVPYIAASQLEKYIANYLSGAGQETIKSAVGEGIKLVGSMAKSGKVPTEKEFDAAVQSILFSLLLGGVVKNLGSFQKKWAYQSKDMLQGKILPDRLAKFADVNVIPNTIKAKMYAEVMNKVSEEAMKAGFAEVAKSAKGGEDANKLSGLAAKALEKDKRIEKLIDAELKKALKKHKIPAK